MNNDASLTRWYRYQPIMVGKLHDEVCNAFDSIGFTERNLILGPEVSASAESDDGIVLSSKLDPADLHEVPLNRIELYRTLRTAPSSGSVFDMTGRPVVSLRAQGTSQHGGHASEPSHISINISAPDGDVVRKAFASIEADLGIEPVDIEAEREAWAEAMRVKYRREADEAATVPRRSSAKPASSSGSTLPWFLVLVLLAIVVYLLVS